MPDSPSSNPNLSELGRALLGSESGSKPSGPWVPPTPENLQKLLPGYEVIQMLGRGGMGAVYMGKQISLDRPVAIKILSNDLEAKDPSFAERFKNEARAMAKLSHPGIVAVHDFGQTADGMLYIVMEFIEGTDVQKMITASGRLHTEHAMAITAHVCDALAYAHERGIIHRDIKPANIMVGYDGVVKVADFGLAKVNSESAIVGLTQSGMAMGTLHYMAPEVMVLGSAVDQRADIYAVGVMLYQMLTGKVPQGLFELPSMQVKGLDPRYDGIISRALREDRDQRYANARLLRADLDAILTQPVAKVEAPVQQNIPAKAPAALPTQARPQRPGGQGYRPPQSRNPTPVAPPRKKPLNLLLVIAMFAVLGALGWFALKTDRTATPLSPTPVVTQNVLAPETSKPTSIVPTASAIVESKPSTPQSAIFTDESTKATGTVPTVAPSIVRPEVPLPPDNELLIDLDFSRPESYLSELRPEELRNVKDGALICVNEKRGVWHRGPEVIRQLELQDFVCEVEAKQSSATGQDAWGLGMARREPPTQWWTSVLIRNDGMMGSTVFYVFDGAQHIPWTKIPDWESSENEIRLRVEVKDKVVRVLVNGVLLGEKVQPHLLASHLTLLTFGNPGFELHVTRLRVWNSKDTPNTVSTQVTQSAVAENAEIRTRIANYQKARQTQLSALTENFRKAVVAAKSSTPAGAAAFDVTLALLEKRFTEIEILPTTVTVRPLLALTATDSKAPARLKELASIYDAETRKTENSLVTSLDQSLAAVQAAWAQSGKSADATALESFRKELRKAFAVSEVAPASAANPSPASAAGVTTTKPDAGFIDLFSLSERDAWKQCGQGELNFKNDGTSSSWFPSGSRYYGVAWYSKRTFKDFVWKVEFRGMQAEYNSGLRLRFPKPDQDVNLISDSGYEISIYDPQMNDAKLLTGAIGRLQAPSSSALNPPGEWNSLEVSAVGQKYVVTLNGKVVNRFTGDRLTEGYIGLESHMRGSVEFRNSFIKPLP